MMLHALVRTLMLPLLFAGMLAAAAPAHAAAAAFDTGRIADILTTLGYQPRAGQGVVSTTIPDRYSYNVNFQGSSDGQVMFVFISLATLSADDVNRLDTAGLLHANDVGFQYFSLRNDNGSTDVYLQSSMPTAAASPESVRYTLSALVARANATDRLWNTQLWN